MLLGTALLGRKIPRTAWAAVFGGLLPDLPNLLIVSALKLYGLHDLIIYGLLYWQHWWQLTNAFAHNVWLWTSVFVASILLRERRNLGAAAIDGWTLPIIMAAAALLHIAIDFVTHREDAYMVFWPVTYRFISPVSYWDPNHFGNWVGHAEIVIGIACALILIRRFRHPIARAALSVAIVIYLAQLAGLRFG
jgi:hypothetical protein